MDVKKTGSVTDLIGTTKGMGPSKFEMIMEDRFKPGAAAPSSGVVLPSFVEEYIKRVRPVSSRERKKAARKSLAMKSFLAGRNHADSDVIWLRVCENRMETRKRGKKNPTAPPRKHIRARSIRRGSRNLDGSKKVRLHRGVKLNRESAAEQMARETREMWRQFTVADLKFSNQGGGLYEVQSPAEDHYLGDVAKIDGKWHAIHPLSVGETYKTRKAAGEAMLKIAQGV